MLDETAIQAADHAMRNWEGPSGPVPIGSEAHLRLFTRMLLETHNPYKPAVIEWPKLDQAALKRLTSLPIWDIAVQTEGRAAARVRSYAALARDAGLREALEMDAGEEARHKEVLGHLVASYGIKLEPEPGYPAPKDPEWAWLVTGFSECIDSFFAFGLFDLAKQSGYFPPELVETFEPVIQEEARHILFFVNWLAWYRKHLPPLARLRFEARVLAVWAFLAMERIGIARDMEADGGKEDANFAMTGSGAVGIEISARGLIALCLKENDRRMAGYDTRLPRPATVPALARLALRVMPKGGARIGSDAHRQAFCRQFIDTHLTFDPETLPWPELDQASLDRLRRVPFWQQVRHTERRAGMIVAAFTETITDPLLREAVALQGIEEARHAKLLQVMIERYGIDAPELPMEPLGPDLETAFMDFGFGECLDSFLGFGAFKFARQSEFLPDAMFDIFETLMIEETRHIVFFVNWMAWRQAQKGGVAARLPHLTTARFYGRAIGRLVATIRGGQDANEGRDFSATEASMFLDGFSFERFVETCYAENARRMAAFDEDLRTPGFLPSLAGAALKGLRAWNRLRPGLLSSAAPPSARA